MGKTKLGMADVDITPLAPVNTIGFGRPDELSRGVLHNLSAQISVWQFDEYTCCLVTIDHIGFLRKHADNLRTELAHILSTDSESVMLCFAHTHSAPNESLEAEYFRFVCSQIKEGVKTALGNLEPVKAAWGNAFAEIGINRRSECNETDNRVGVLKVVEEVTGKLKLLLLRVTAHANVLKADNYLISPDYFGTTRDLLAKKFNCPVMLTQGASGNVAPKYFKASYIPPDANDETRFIRSETALEDMANEILTSVKKVIDEIAPAEINHLEMYSKRIDLYADVPTYEKALTVATEARENAGIDGTAWLAEVKCLLEKGVTSQTETIELQYFAVANGCICGVANEIMCEFALRASKAIKNNFFYLGGYTNGCTGYFPTEEEYDKGGYEVFWSMLFYYIYHGRVFPLNRNSASELIKTAVENAPVYLHGR